MNIIGKNTLAFLFASSIASVAMAAPGDAPYAKRLSAQAREAKAQVLLLGEEGVDTNFNKRIDIFIFEKTDFQDVKKS